MACSAPTCGGTEQEEFEHAILEDLKLLNIVDYQVTYTSDSFDKILDCAESLIRAGKAYVDDTPVDQVGCSDGVRRGEAGDDRPTHLRHARDMLGAAPRCARSASSASRARRAAGRSRRT